MNLMSEIYKLCDFYIIKYLNLLFILNIQIILIIRNLRTHTKSVNQNETSELNKTRESEKTSELNRTRESDKTRELNKVYKQMNYLNYIYYDRYLYY